MHALRCPKELVQTRTLPWLGPGEWSGDRISAEVELSYRLDYTTTKVHYRMYLGKTYIRIHNNLIINNLLIFGV